MHHACKSQVSKKGRREFRILPDQNPNHSDKKDDALIQRMHVTAYGNTPDGRTGIFSAIYVSTRAKVCKGKLKPTT